MPLKQRIYKGLKWSQKYTQTDMVYLAKGGFWLGMGQIITGLASFLLTLAFANLVPKETFGTYKHGCWMMAIFVHDAEKMAKTLGEKEIDTRPMFYPMNQLLPYKQDDENFPFSTILQKGCLMLPSYPELKDEEIEFICSIVKDNL